MAIRKLLPATRLISSITAGAALLLPCISQGLSIGDITLQSRLGEPLRAEVLLLTENSEHVDDACLTLLPPEPDGDRSGFLLKANLSIKTNGARQYISIVSNKPFNDAFAQLRLQVKCPGMGSIVKSLTILPDLDATTPQEQPVAPPDVSANAAGSPPAALAEKPAPAATRTQHQPPPPATASKIKPVREQRRPPTRDTREKRPESFRLKLSGDPIDASRIGKISPEERAALLAQQKLLDADDQTASFLALQHQVKLLQDELGAIKLQLAQLSPASGTLPVASIAASAPQPAPITNTTNTQTPAISAAKRPETQPDNTYWQNGLFAAIGLLAILALWLGLRYYTKVKSRGEMRAYQNTEPLSPPAIAKTVEFTAPPRPRPAASPETRIAPKPSPLPIETISHPASPQPMETSEDEAMLDEAKLYASHGRPLKSIEILLEIVKLFPAKVEAWSLLLSLYSSLGKAAEFGGIARKFLEQHQGNPLWNGIQALGRTLDPDDPLYADQQSTATRLLAAGAAISRRQLGDILMEMGALSRQDLQNCIDDYDPGKHGRLGGYLVTRKAITLAQLDQALLLQQGIGQEMPASKLPSLQDVENLLADFDPKRDGSVNEFLASRDAAAATPSSPPVQQPTVPDELSKPLFKEHETLDFVLETSPGRPVLDLEFESSTGKALPLDLEVAPLASAHQEKALDFPEIQLDFGSDELSGDEADKR